MQPTRILMVCLGNICRSPLAEGIMRQHLPPQGFEVDSAGTANYHVGHAPDRRSIQVARQHGIDISGLRGRQFTPIDFDRFDYIFVMDRSNLSDVLRQARNEHDRLKVQLMLEPVLPGEQAEVPDPYYGELRDFEAVYAMLDQACAQVAHNLLLHD